MKNLQNVFCDKIAQIQVGRILSSSFYLILSPKDYPHPLPAFFFDATGTKNGQSRTTPTKNDVTRYAHNDVAPDGRNDVMVAHYAVRRNIIYEVNIIAEGNITCPQGQTSFG